MLCVAFLINSNTPSHLAGHSFAVKRANSKASVADLTEILERGQLRILTTRQHSVDYAGRSNSPEKQMLDDYAREMGLTPVMIWVREASRLVPELLAGNGDLIIGATPLFMTDTHRLAQTEAIGQYQYQVVAGKTIKPFSHITELAGKRIGLQTTSPAWPLLEILQQHNPAIELVALPGNLSRQAVVEKVAGGEYDLTIVEQAELDAVLRQQIAVTTVFTLTEQIPASWLVRADNQVLHASLNNFLLRKNLAHRNLPVYYADLADLQARRFLRVITKPDPHNYFLKQGEPVGFAYELIRKFARQKKLRVQMLVASSDEEMLEWLEQGKGDIISANLLLEGKRLQGFSQSTDYSRADCPEDGDTAQRWTVVARNTELQASINAFLHSQHRTAFYNVIYKKYFRAGRRPGKMTQFPDMQALTTLSPFDDIARTYADRYAFDWRLVVAQMHQESLFNPAAVSDKGAQGLMQILPGTAQELGFSDVHTPAHAIHAGVLYMKKLRDRFESNVPIEERTWFALAAYNAGYSRIKRARKLAEKKGLNPDKWFGHVEQAMRRLPGCHCGQTIAYVHEIRNLYDTYVGMTGNVQLAAMRAGVRSDS